MEGRSKDSSLNINNFVDSVENFKLKDIKDEIKEEESVVVPSHIEYYTANNVKQEIKEEVKERDEEQVARIPITLLIVVDMFTVQVQMHFTSRSKKQ